MGDGGTRAGEMVQCMYEDLIADPQVYIKAGFDGIPVLGSEARKIPGACQPDRLANWWDGLVQ